MASRVGYIMNCSSVLAFALMSIVRFYGYLLSDYFGIYNGLRYPAYTFTLASVTRILIFALRLGFVCLFVTWKSTMDDNARPLMSQRILCIICNICVNSCNAQRRYPALEQNARVISVISLWISPVIITEDDFVCEACFNLALQTVNNELHIASEQCAGPSHHGHKLACLMCGRSLKKMQKHLIRNHTVPYHTEMIQTVESRIAPRQVTPSDHLCHACFMKVRRQVIRNLAHEENRNMCVSQKQEHHTDAVTSAGPEEMAEESPDLVNSETDSHHEQHTDAVSSAASEEVAEGSLDLVNPEADSRHEHRPSEHAFQQNIIYLENYKRSPNTASHCIFYGCHQISGLHTVSDPLRRTLLCNYKFYIPSLARVCTEHLYQNNWDSLFNQENSISHFTAQQIEHMLSFMNVVKPFLDFSSITSVEQIDDHLFGYWMGMTKNNFLSLLIDLPRVLETHQGILGLACILIKMRTGDSDVRISTLLNVPRTTLGRLMSKVREIMLQDFVPRHLGINHMPRDELLQHNLRIPNGIYNENNSHSIVICDGSYIYLNKSANYMFQKESYSLHKYRNLLKPFMLVTCDGYILDCYGPYKATTSDADIMKTLFENENTPLRQYFQQNDIFILDRGFRDSINLLESCNYNVYVPDSVSAGEHQLTTTQANRSRCVTICRWVVEVVNGYFKRDFRLFRFDYFNKAVPNMMIYFQIAACLINKFGVRLHDRDDAAQIVSIIRERMPLENNLSQAVITLNLNRRASFFRSITASDNNIDFPRLEYNELILFALGTYQLRQARSYYGEHVRFHGRYIIEVCRDNNILQMNDFNLRGSGVLIRGKIKSRHIGRRQYYVYILVDNNLNGSEGIIEYCFNCLVGRRTIGCCVHVMTLVWYLGWARYQSNLEPPASFLDEVVTREDLD